MLIRYDTSQFRTLGNAFAAAGKNAPLAIVRAINHTGDKARNQMRRVLVKQTGLKAKTIRRAVTSTRAFNGGDYVIKSSGGNIRLMFFRARETRRGETAAPWGTRRLYAGSFMKGGQFPNRVDLGKRGAVFRRTGKGRMPIESVRSGLFIPTEMVTGDSEAAFYGVVSRDLGPRLAHELYRVLPW